MSHTRGQFKAGVYSRSLRRRLRAIAARMTRSPEPEHSPVESLTWPNRSAAVSPVAPHMASVLRRPLRLERPGRPQRYRTWGPMLSVPRRTPPKPWAGRPERTEAVSEEIGRQVASMPDKVRAALRKLPPVGENQSRPLGPGVLASGILGAIIRDLQAGLAGTDR